MSTFLQLTLYAVGFIFSFWGMWKIDFNRFMRIGRKEFAVLIYIVLSIALGYLVGTSLITIGSLFHDIHF